MPKIKSLDTGSRKLANMNKVAEVKEFLSAHYEIRVNRFDPNPNRAIIKPKSNKLKYINFDEISLHLLEEGIQCSDSMLRKIIKSPNHMISFDPIADYFESLKGKWKGVSHIDLLASHFRTRDYHDLGRDYYQMRWYRYFKKWLVAAVACALGLRPNDVALGLIHDEEGIGKTYFFEFLTMPIKDYLFKTKEDPKNKFDMETLFAQNFLILFDEMVGLSKRTEAQTFKKVMSDKEVLVYLPRDPYPKQMPRIASAAFTSNFTPEKGGFIGAGMSYRRLLTFELESINQEYSRKVDVDQLWAEVMALLEQDFDYAWNLTDWGEFKQVNERYKIETASTKYVKMYFHKPINGSGDWLQPQEILQHLLANKLIRSDDKGNINNENIGRSLTQLGYNKKKIRKGSESVWAYQVEKV